MTTPRGSGRTHLKLLVAAALVATLLVAEAPGALAASPISLDGQFDDWSGHISWNDEEPDPERYPAQMNFQQNIQTVYFGTNPDEEPDNWLYFRVDRFPKEAANPGIPDDVYHSVYIDFNDNGRFYDRGAGGDDFVLYCAFHPDPQPSQGELDYAHVFLVLAKDVFTADGTGTLDKLSPSAVIWEQWGPWGEPYVDATKSGGLKVEFGVPCSAFQPPMALNFQTIRFYFAASLNDPLKKLDYPQQDFCPYKGDYQWTPVPTLGTVGTVLLVAAGLAIGYYTMTRRRRAAARPGGSGQ